MLTESKILEKVLRGTTEYQHRHNLKRQRIVHIAKTWAVMQVYGSRYGCGYGQNYVSGALRLLLLPEDLHCNGGRDIWDSARDKQGAVTKKRIARVVEVVKEAIKQDRSQAWLLARITLLTVSHCQQSTGVSNGGLHTVGTFSSQVNGSNHPRRES